MIVDILVEFIELLIHNIIYASNIYPRSIFEKQVKYDLPVRYIVHPDVTSYISNCIVSIKELIHNKTLQKVDIVFYLEEKKSSVFTFHINFASDSTDSKNDPYLITMEQSLRAHFLNIINMQCNFGDGSETSTFKIYLHTDEISAMSLPKCTDKDIPLVECDVEGGATCEKVIPVGNIQLENIQIQTFMLS